MNQGSTTEPANHTRHSVAVDEPFVVFMVGARLNRLTWPGKLLQLNRSMGAMQRELLANPDLGCVHIENWAGRTSVSVQYWRSLDHLLRYARNPDAEHLPAWRNFNKRFAADPAFGIWHEIHNVLSSKALYVNMPSLGLGRSGLDEVGREPFRRPVRSAR